MLLPLPAARRYGHLELLIANAGILGKMQVGVELRFKGLFYVRESAPVCCQVIHLHTATQQSPRQTHPTTQLPQDTTEENWRDIFSTNVEGVFHVARAAYPLLRRSKQSKVVISGSIAGGAQRSAALMRGREGLSGRLACLLLLFEGRPGCAET